MTAGGGDLFIVDNSHSGWTGLKYLEQWSEISSALDVATGFFEIGSLLALDGDWQRLEKIRILMGDEITGRTRRALLDGIKDKVSAHLDTSIETQKKDNPFLAGVAAIVQALKSGQVECRIYNKDTFHAKAYITHPRLEVVGSKALVGSSNFTHPGLTQNIELNIQVQGPGEVVQLQEWYEQHWEEAVDVTPDILKVIERHVTEWAPFDVYSKALYEYFRGRDVEAGVWEETESVMFQELDQYQREAYWSLVKIAGQHNGAFLCDGVGLGKTFVGLMLIERLVHDKKHVVLFAPKGAKEGVWIPALKKYLPHIFNEDFSNLAIFSHTDLQRDGFKERFERISQIADAVVIDEAHHFRNTGRAGDATTWKGRSRYWRLFDTMGGRKKQAFMLTATPINNRLTDLRHMIELFSGGDAGFFARSLGINNLVAYFSRLEASLKGQLGEAAGENLSENLENTQQFLEQDKIFNELVVQRSRAYATASQERQYGAAVVFPKRSKPQVAEYSVRKTYGTLLDMVEKAFDNQTPLFNLPFYDPLKHYIGDPDDITAFLETRLRMVVSLIRTQFLKRFESSVFSFEMSCDRLLKKLLAFLAVHCDSDAEKEQLASWISTHEDILGYATQKQNDFWGDDEEAEDAELVPADLIGRAEEDPLTADKYDLPSIIKETFEDLDKLAAFLVETKKFKPTEDDKLKKLLRLLNQKDMTGRKLIIFTEFADTARYLHQQLQANGVDSVERVDGGSAGSRYDVVKRFAPYYNGMTSSELEEQGMSEIRVLVATDVLSEGLNLQDGTRLINYDIHWNPVRLMQRIGRVDRRMNPEIEKRLIADHPEVSADRGKVAFWNFLPPNELNTLLSLYRTVTRKALVISSTMGIEGKSLLTEEDDYEALREFNKGYEGVRSLEEDLHLELQDMLAADPELQPGLLKMPGAIFSGRKKPARGTEGVFFCFRLPAWDNELQAFAEDAGSVAWYLYDLNTQETVEGPEAIIASIECKPETPRRCVMERPLLKDIRDEVIKHIKNTYLKQVDAPLGVDARLVCWMEIGA